MKGELLPAERSIQPQDVFAALDPIDREIVKLKYENPNLTYAQIGQLIPTKRLSKQAVNKRIKKHHLKEALDLVQGDIVQLYRTNQARAVEILRLTMEGENTSYLRYQAARDFLSGILHSPLAAPPPTEVSDLIFDDPNAPKGLAK